MADDKKLVQLNAFMAEANAQMANQPDSTFTVAKFRLAYTSLDKQQSAVTIDNVSVFGACNATAQSAVLNSDFDRVDVNATFTQFELRGRSHIIGPFKVVLQEGKEAVGIFRQKYADSLWPLIGEWRVPFLVSSSFGDLIPRPSEPEVTLKSAEPGEFGFPPIGAWFEKWDPINLVDVKAPDGPTVAVIETAMHMMMNAGSEPMMPDILRE